MTRGIDWYLRRLQQMSPAEIGWRVADRARHVSWSRDQVLRGASAGIPSGLCDDRQFPTPLPTGTRQRVSDDAKVALLAAADRLFAGEWLLLGTPRPDIVCPDWFLDPVTGRRAPQDRLAFRIDHRDESLTGNVKSVWELSRHHHLTVLAAAWWLTGDDGYAELVDAQLRSWWAQNPFLSGVHWASGIELGIRLISWAWIRRLLHEWPKVEDLFDDNEDALRQIWWHQRYLAAFRSRGSSANNHVIAEAAGQLVAGCAFPWYAESDSWRADAGQLLEHELRASTFASGVNRELATDYHRFVTELGLVAAVEAAAAGHPLERSTWSLLTASLDAAAAIVDCSGRPPRQGDGDEGRALVLDDPEHDAWSQLLGLGGALVGRLPWWPTGDGTVVGAVTSALLPSLPIARTRPVRAPRVFPDAGICLLRTPAQTIPEIWVRCDGGPHGYLSIAAHAHADALSLEVRYDGVEVLVDPGTYCYHGEPEWRRYFRSTLAHNTVEVDGANQSVEGGPFLWSAHAATEVTAMNIPDDDIQTWAASHTGYARLDPALRHQRTVRLDPHSREVAVLDKLTGSASHIVRLAFHLAPEVQVRLGEEEATLTWSGRVGTATATLLLPAAVHWTAHRGEINPVLGWYSPRFGRRTPATTLIGSGAFDTTLELSTRLCFPVRQD